MDAQAFKYVYLIKNKINKERSCKDKLKMICKFVWTKYFINKLRNHYKGAGKLTDFQIGFKNRFIFTKSFNTFIYKRRIQYHNIYVSMLV
jgi:hypothetical protein